MKVNSTLTVYLSDCCGALTTVAGRTTNYYTCRCCGKPCWLKADVNETVTAR